MVSDERGQLILVGAIAIALVVLGLVLIVNTALFTQVVGSEGTVESAKEGGVTGQEVGHAIGAVIAEENRNGGGTTYSGDLDALERGLRNQTLETSGSFVSLEYVSTNETGRYIEQSTNDPLTGTPVSDGDVGEFLVTLDTDSSPSETFSISSEDPSGSSRNLSVTVGQDEIELSGAGASGCSDVRVSDGSITIDVRHGVVYGDNSCQFELFDGTEPPYEVTFNDGENMEATYSIATNQTASFDTGHPGGDLIIWSFEYAFTYGSPDVMAESDSRVIDVYD